MSERGRTVACPFLFTFCADIGAHPCTPLDDSSPVQRRRRSRPAEVGTGKGLYSAIVRGKTMTQTGPNLSNSLELASQLWVFIVYFRTKNQTGKKMTLNPLNVIWHAQTHSSDTSY